MTEKPNTPFGFIKIYFSQPVVDNGKTPVHVYILPVTARDLE